MSIREPVLCDQCHQWTGAIYTEEGSWRAVLCGSCAQDTPTAQEEEGRKVLDVEEARKLLAMLRGEDVEQVGADPEPEKEESSSKIKPLPSVD